MGSRGASSNPSSKLESPKPLAWFWTLTEATILFIIDIILPIKCSPVPDLESWWRALFLPSDSSVLSEFRNFYSLVACSSFLVHLSCFQESVSYNFEWLLNNSTRRFSSARLIDLSDQTFHSIRISCWNLGPEVWDNLTASALCHGSEWQQLSSLRSRDTWPPLRECLNESDAVIRLWYVNQWSSRRLMRENEQPLWLWRTLATCKRNSWPFKTINWASIWDGSSGCTALIRNNRWILGPVSSCLGEICLSLSMFHRLLPSSFETKRNNFQLQIDCK